MATAARSAASRRSPSVAASGGRVPGSGSSPKQIWLWRSSTSAASRSAKGRARLVAALDLLLQPGPGREARHLAAGDEDSLAGPRVDSLPGAALGYCELAEAGEVDVASVLEDVGDRVEHRIDGLARLLLVSDPAVAREHVEELSLGHVSSSVRVRAEPNSASRRLGASDRHLCDEDRGAVDRAAEGNPARLRPHGLHRREGADQVAGDRDLAERLGQLAAA